jgi:hypothetical protein
MDFGNLLVRHYTQTGDNNLRVLDLYFEDLFDEEREDHRRTIMMRIYNVYFELLNDEHNEFMNELNANQERYNAFVHYRFIDERFQDVLLPNE